MKTTTNVANISHWQNLSLNNLETGFGKVLLNRKFFNNVSLSAIQCLTDGRSWNHLPRDIQKLKNILHNG